MTEEQRRQEILKAEEAIRGLALEMANASATAAQAEAARRELDEANAAVRESIKMLDRCQEAIRTVADEATEVLSEANARLNETAGSLTSSLNRTEATAEAIMVTQKKTLEVVERQLSRLNSLVIWTLIVAALTAMGVGVAIGLLLLRAGHP